MQPCESMQSCRCPGARTRPRIWPDSVVCLLIGGLTECVRVCVGRDMAQLERLVAPAMTQVLSAAQMAAPVAMPAVIDIDGRSSSQTAVVARKDPAKMTSDEALADFNQQLEGPYNRIRIGKTQSLERCLVRTICHCLCGCVAGQNWRRLRPSLPSSELLRTRSNEPRMRWR
jgi:hypothetical protein